MYYIKTLGNSFIGMLPKHELLQKESNKHHLQP